MTGILLRTLLGHRSNVLAVSFDTGHMIASGSADNTVKLWDKNTGNLLRTLLGHGSWVWSVAFDANDLVASGSSDHTIKLWDKNTGM